MPPRIPTSALSQHLRSALAMGRSITCILPPSCAFHGVSATDLRNISLISPRRTPGNPYPFTQLLINRSAATWKEYVAHEFVRRLGQGTLAPASFVHFIKCVLFRLLLPFRLI